MKRFLIILFVVAFIAAIPLSHNLMAKKPGKFKICHITGTNETGTRLIGHVIFVSENATKAHENHGDHGIGEEACPGAKVGDTCRRRPGPPSDRKHIKNCPVQ